MPVSTIRPDSDAELSSLVNSGGGAAYADIDDPVGSPDSQAVRNVAGTSGYGYFGLSALPSFVTVDSVTVRASVSSINYTTDLTALNVRLFKSDRTTPLSDQSELATEGSSGEVSVVLTGLASTTDNAVWDGATLYIEWNYTDITADGGELHIEAIQVEAGLTPPAAPGPSKASLALGLGL